MVRHESYVRLYILSDTNRGTTKKRMSEKIRTRDGQSRQTKNASENAQAEVGRAPYLVTVRFLRRGANNACQKRSQARNGKACQNSSENKGPGQTRVALATVRLVGKGVAKTKARN